MLSVAALLGVLAGLSGLALALAVGTGWLRALRAAKRGAAGRRSEPGAGGQGGGV